MIHLLCLTRFDLYVYLDQLVSINGKATNDAAVAHAWLHAHQEEGEGDNDTRQQQEDAASSSPVVTIVVHHPGGATHLLQTLIEKPTPTSKVGLAVQQTQRGHVLISAVSGYVSKTASSLLNIGDRLLTINQQACPCNASAVVQRIASIPRYVTLLTETHGTTALVMVGDVVGTSSGGRGRGRGRGGITTSTLTPTATHLWNRTSYDYDSDARLNQQHFCFCIWMIIISLLVVGAVIFRPFE